MGEEQIKETTILGNLWLKEDEEQCSELEPLN